MAKWDEFSQKKIVEVRQRVQTVVVYEELVQYEDPSADADVPVRKEAIVDSFDRPLQAEYS